MNETILITGYNGSLAKRLSSYLKEKYSLVYLSSRKKSVNNKEEFEKTFEKMINNDSSLSKIGEIK